jgi:hypothetical protein
MSPQIDAWLAAAITDAESRGLPELKPLLETLAKSTVALRSADRTATKMESDARGSGHAGSDSTSTS